MRKIFFILALFVSVNSYSQFSLPFSSVFNIRQVQNTLYEMVAYNYADLANLSPTERSFSAELLNRIADSGLYNKFIAFYIGKHWNDTCFNLIVPFRYNGALMLTIKSGVVPNSSGIVMGIGDTLDTHFVNDRAQLAPYTGVGWYVTGNAVQSQIVQSQALYKIYPKEGDGKAYVNIWAQSNGLSVGTPLTGFNYAQRLNVDTVQVYQGVNKYSENIPVSGSGFKDTYTTYVLGNSTGYTIKYLWICEALTEEEAIKLKSILDAL